MAGISRQKKKILQNREWLAVLRGFELLYDRLNISLFIQENFAESRDIETESNALVSNSKAGAPAELKAGFTEDDE